MVRGTNKRIDFNSSTAKNTYNQATIIIINHYHGDGYLRTTACL